MYVLLYTCGLRRYAMSFHTWTVFHFFKMRPLVATHLFLSSVFLKKHFMETFLTYRQSGPILLTPPKRTQSRKRWQKPATRFQTSPSLLFICCVRCHLHFKLGNWWTSSAQSAPVMADKSTFISGVVFEQRTVHPGYRCYYLTVQITLCVCEYVCVCARMFIICMGWWQSLWLKGEPKLIPVVWLRTLSIY